MDSRGKILCSTGALVGKPNNRNHKLLEEFSKLLECDGFEFMMYSAWYDIADEIVTYLNKMRIITPVMHCDKNIGEAISRGGEEELDKTLSIFKSNCRIAQEIGAKKIVVHLWGGMTSDQNFSNNLEAYKYLDEISDEHDIELLIENVVCNQKDPMTHWCELVELYPNISFVFDTKMAAFHQQLDLLYKSEYSWLTNSGHIKHYHINDYNGGYMDWGNLCTLPIGMGNIDFDKLFTFIRETNYEGMYTIEATAYNQEGVVDIGMLNRCFRYIREH